MRTSESPAPTSVRSRRCLSPRRTRRPSRSTIGNAAFTPFHANATCAIRPQSLIAERYVDCSPGTSNQPELPLIRRGSGAGTYLLPVTQTSSPIDPDIVQNISQESIRQRLAIILNELGTGLAARGSDLNAVIRRANPALGYTEQVFKILAEQNHQLEQLASASDTVLAPLARARTQIAGFVVNANTTATASAQRSAAISRSIQLLPTFLSKLKPLMADLGDVADQGTPLMASLGQAANGINRQFTALAPFARAARTALINLGNAAQESQGPLVATEPLADQLKGLGAAAAPSSALLDQLTASLDNTGAIEQLMGVLFNGTGAGNGFNADGHYVRSAAILGSCTGYVTTPTAGCSANFSGTADSADTASAPGVPVSTSTQSGGTAPNPSQTPASGAGSGQGSASYDTAAVAAVVRQALRGAGPAPSSNLAGLLDYLIGGGR